MKQLLKWFEIPSKNFERAVNFYQKVLDVEISCVECGDEKMGCFPDDGINVSGAIIQAQDFIPGDTGVLVSLFCDGDLQNTLKIIVSQGGKIIIPKTKIEVEGRGYFAVFLDTEGNKLGLYSDI